MNKVMLASFMDEIAKIAANTVVGFSSSAVGKPASPTSAAGAFKPVTKPTDYSVVHNQTRTADMNTAAETKAVPPPTVRT